MSAYVEKLVKGLVARVRPAPRAGLTVLIPKDRCFLCAHPRDVHAIGADGVDRRCCHACAAEGAVLVQTLDNGQHDRLDCVHPFFPDES